MPNEQVIFRVFEMPCCHIQICWVNHRLPNYCPECGKRVYSEIRHQAPLLRDDEAWLKYKEK